MDLPETLRPQGTPTRPRRDTTVQLDDNPSIKVAKKLRDQAAQEVVLGGESEYLKNDIAPPRRTFIQKVAHHPNAVVINNPIAFLATGGGIGSIGTLMALQASRNGLPYELASLLFLAGSALVGVVLHHVDKNLINDEMLFLQRHIRRLQGESREQDDVKTITFGSSKGSISPRSGAETDSMEGNVALDEDASVESHIDTDPPGRTFMQNIARNHHTVMINNPVAFLTIGGGIGVIVVLMATLSSRGSLPYQIASLVFLLGTAIAGLVLNHVDNNLTDHEMSALQGQFQQLRQGFKTHFEQRKGEMFLENFETLETSSDSESATETEKSSDMDETKNRHSVPSIVIEDYGSKPKAGSEDDTSPFL